MNKIHITLNKVYLHIYKPVYIIIIIILFCNLHVISTNNNLFKFNDLFPN